MPALADRALHTLRTDFISSFASCLRQFSHAVVVFAAGEEAAWCGADGRLHRVVVKQYSPVAGRPGAPLTLRIVVVHGASTQRVPATVFRALGVDALPVCRFGNRLEMTVLPAELAAFGPWAAVWVAAHLDPTVRMPPAPHQLDRPLPPNSERPGYAWTTAAWAAYRPWETEFLARRRR